MEATALNPAQLYMLQVMSRIKTDEELRELRQLISSYFARKAEDEMDRLWSQGLWDNEKNEAVLHEHLRTPYSHG